MIRSERALLAVFICGALLMTMSAGADTFRTRSVDVKRQYDEVASRLDAGGDLFLIANIDGLFEEIIGFVDVLDIPMCSGIATGSTRENIRNFLEDSGFFSIHSAGISSVPQADGMHVIKSFISRDPAAADLPLWRGVVGWKPHEMQSLQFVPADAVMVRAGTAELPELWKLVKSGVNETSDAAKAAVFNQSVFIISAMTGRSLDDLISTIEDEMLISVQLDMASTVSVHSASAEIDMPEPSVLMAFKATDDSILSTVTEQLATNGLPMVESTVLDYTLYTVTLPFSWPIPVSPTIAECGGYLLLGSGTNVVAEALHAFNDKDGLIEQDSYRKATAGLPVINNGLLYIDPSFRRLVVDRKIGKLKAMAAGSGSDALIKMAEDSICSTNEQPEAYIIINLRTGIYCRGRSNSGGRDMILRATMTPLATFSALSARMGIKTRSAKERSICDGNLDRITAGKGKWAAEKKRKNGARISKRTLNVYIDGQALPKCPESGEYALGRIGTAPQCSVHSLQSK